VSESESETESESESETEFESEPEFSPPADAPLALRWYHAPEQPGR